MVWWNPFRRNEARQSFPAIKDSFAQMLYGADFGPAVSGISVTTETALLVPAVSAAVNFIAETIASLPLQIFSETATGRSENHASPPFRPRSDVVQILPGFQDRNPGGLLVLLRFALRRWHAGRFGARRDFAACCS